MDEFVKKLGGRKFSICIFGILVLVGYGVTCIKVPHLVQIATAFCAAIAAIIGSFCAINGLNDYTAMKREAKNGTNKVVVE